jgi:hypothetical protein
MMPLPEPDAVLGDSLINIGENHYTEAQLIAYGRQCVEAAAKICDEIDIAESPKGVAEAIRNMLKGEKE